MRHDAYAAAGGRGDDAGAVGPDEAGAGLGAQGRVDAEHVVQGHVFGDGDDEGDFGFDGFEDGGGGVGGGDQDSGGGGAGGWGEGGEEGLDCWGCGEVGE